MSVYRRPIMVLSLIIGAILGYAVLMFILHEVFKKFFHTILIIGFIVMALGVVYFVVFRGI